jgi:hypothetical protein
MLTNRVLGPGDKYGQEQDVGHAKCRHSSVVYSVDHLFVGPVFIYRGGDCVPYTQRNQQNQRRQNVLVLHVVKTARLRKCARCKILLYCFVDKMSIVNMNSSISRRTKNKSGPQVTYKPQTASRTQEQPRLSYRATANVFGWTTKY